MDPFPFIVGRGRSGTTLLRAMLDSHPDMAIPDECHFIVPMSRRRHVYERREGLSVDAFVRDLERHVAGRGLQETTRALAEELSRVPARDFPDAARRFYRTYARARGKRRYGDKTPIHVLHIDLLARLFPEARFVHVVRDGRDAALSYVEAGFGDDLWEAAVYWKRFVTAGRRSGAHLGRSRYRELRYEALVASPETSLRTICDFLALPFHDDMLRYFERAGEVAGGTPYYRNVYLPPTRGLRDWRGQLSAREVAVFEALAGDLLGELGYDRAGEAPAIGARVRAASCYARVQARRAVRGVRKRLLGSGREGHVSGPRPHPVHGAGAHRR